MTSAMEWLDAIGRIARYDFKKCGRELPFRQSGVGR